LWRHGGATLAEPEEPTSAGEAEPAHRTADTFSKPALHYNHNAGPGTKARHQEQQENWHSVKDRTGAI
jgi:hypothetical protein